VTSLERMVPKISYLPTLSQSTESRGVCGAPPHLSQGMAVALASSWSYPGYGLIAISGPRYCG